MTKEPLTITEKRLLDAIYESTVGNEPPLVAAHRRSVASNADYRQRVKAFVNFTPIELAESND